MSDLYWGAGVFLTVSLFSALLARRIARRLPARKRRIACALTVLLILA